MSASRWGRGAGAVGWESRLCGKRKENSGNIFTYLSLFTAHVVFSPLYEFEKRYFCKRKSYSVISSPVSFYSYVFNVSNGCLRLDVRGTALV